MAPATALLPLRLFLGATFVYSGIQKLRDPGFLHPGCERHPSAGARSPFHGFSGAAR